MIAKIFLISVLLVTFVSAQDTVNPCTGKRFVRNTRGCSWFFVCDLETGLVESQNRCEPNMYFNEADQVCDLRENVECDIPSPPTECPTENGIFIISHPHTCSKFTGSYLCNLKLYLAQEFNLITALSRPNPKLYFLFISSSIL